MKIKRIEPKQNRCSALLQHVSNQAGSGALSRGFTLVEITMVLAVLAVLFAFAVSPMARTSARTDVDLAREEFVHALGAARGASIRTNTPVRVVISEDSGKYRLVAGFTSHRRSLETHALPDYTLPEHVTVQLTEGMSEIEYLPIGHVSTTGTITLSSRDYPEYVINIRIANRGGLLEVDDGLMQKVDRLHSRTAES